MSLETNNSYPLAMGLAPPPPIFPGGVAWSNINNMEKGGPGNASSVLYTMDYNHATQKIVGKGISWVDSHGNPFVFPNEAAIVEVDATFQMIQTGGSSTAGGFYGLAGVAANYYADSYPSQFWPFNTLTTRTFNGSSQWGPLWGASKITPQQLNDPSFGWWFSAVCTQEPGTGADVTLVSVVLRVTYTITAGLDQSACFNVGGTASPASWQGGTIPEIVQYKTGWPTVTLDSPTTPGNTVLSVAMVSGSSAIQAVPPASLTTLFAFGCAAYSGGASAGYMPVVSAGDGQSLTWSYSGWAEYPNYLACTYELRGNCSFGSIHGTDGTIGPYGTITASTGNITTLGGILLFAYFGWYFIQYSGGWTPAPLNTPEATWEGLAMGMMNAAPNPGTLTSTPVTLDVHNETSATLSPLSWIAIGAWR